MTDTATPQSNGTVESSTNTSLSLREGMSAIESLLTDDQETDTRGTDGAKPAVEAKPVDVSDEAEIDDADILDLDDDDGIVDSESQPETPLTIDDDYEIEVDGQKIPLGELKKGNLRQSDYSRKTAELSQERKAFEAEQKQFKENAEIELRKRFEFIDQYANKFIPQKPVYDPSDPVGFLEANAKYEADMQEWKQLGEHFNAQRTQSEQQQQAQHQEWLAEQRNALRTRVPALKDANRLKAFKEDLGTIAIKDYGLTAEEIPMIEDARYMAILHDAIQYRKAVAKKAAVQQDLKTKPKLENKQRMQVQTAQSRDRLGRFEEHRKNGTIASAARSIEDSLTDL